MKAPTLNVPLSLSPSEASVLLHLIEDRLCDPLTGFTQQHLESLRDKVNVALYGDPAE